ncbi:Protein SGE1 [Nakaseomyces bracarensis]|uniref:Protein SGE1 n=1 Tax=Nakaseomyces bracarensis TaxID=273131 RepID=A0ABR4NSK6_9SACH
MHITPTFKGYLETEIDALLVLQACMDGKLNFVNRRPSDIERPYLIVPGNIFVFRETQSGIKRWTDGISWSPSRISGRFLIYKELNKRAPRLSMNPVSEGSSIDSFDEKSLLPVVYTGFIKKTFSLKMRVTTPAETDSGKKRGREDIMETFHIVSYYVESDVKKNVMTRPSKTHLIEEVRINENLMKIVESLPQGNGKSNGMTTSPHSSSCSTPSVTSNSSVTSSVVGSPVTVESSTINSTSSMKRKYDAGSTFSDNYNHGAKRFRQESTGTYAPVQPQMVSPQGIFVPPPTLLPRPSSYKVLENAVGTPVAQFHYNSENEIIHLPKPSVGDEVRNNRVLLLPCYDSILASQSNNNVHFANQSAYGNYGNTPQNNYSISERNYSSINRNTSDSVNFVAPKNALPQGEFALPRFVHPLTSSDGKATGTQAYMQS